MRTPIDLAGLRFGRLLVMHENGRIRRAAAWLCLCDCGKECTVIGSYLMHRKTRSCGCLRRETYVANMTGRAKDIARNAKGGAKGGDNFAAAKAMEDVFGKPKVEVDRGEKRWHGAEEAITALNSAWRW